MNFERESAQPQPNGTKELFWMLRGVVTPKDFSAIKWKHLVNVASDIMVQ